jgi:hypothetical protein
MPCREEKVRTRLYQDMGKTINHLGFYFAFKKICKTYFFALDKIFR